jgi:hypothetical protein
MLPTDVTLIGVDGGATEVKAHAVAWQTPPPSLGGRGKAASGFELRPESAARTYPRVPDFVPMPVADQLAQRDSHQTTLSPAEIEQGRLWISAAAEAILDVAHQSRARRVLVGIGMPGLKTPDGRGIEVINNGPRIPDYLNALESALCGAAGKMRPRAPRAAGGETQQPQPAGSGLELFSPIAALGSDADYCGLGEQYAADGQFRDVQNACYLGGGTGLADALKLRGQLVPFDQARTWIMKSWQIPSALGPTFERLASAASLNRTYAALHVAAGLRTGRCEPDDPVSQVEFPESAALRGDPIAIACLDTAALVLAELIFERLWTIKNGRPAALHRGEAYRRLDPNHEYRGTLLDRIVIGQRVGQIYADPAYKTVFADHVDAHLAELISMCGDEQMGGAYLGEARAARKRLVGANEADADRSGPALAGGVRMSTLRPGLLCPSHLRAAPALGAAIAAARAVE